MKLSRFFGSTTREAMRQVRMALGPDALIVSNRRVNGGVEIYATDATASAAGESDDAAVALPPAHPVAAAASPPPAAPAPSVGASAARPAAASAPAQGSADVMSAIDAMRGALEHRIDELLWGNQLKRVPQAVSLFQMLLGRGFSTALLRAMLKCLPEQLHGRGAVAWARAELISHLPVLTDEDAFWRPGQALALVGPTGVGKTTTLAKLAARCVRRFGPNQLVLVTTDTYRIGAHEQLRRYGELLRVDMHVAQDAAGLRDVVQAARPEQIILIDNVGISQRDRYVQEQGAMLAAAGRPVERLLVLNAASHGDTLDEVARRYATDGGPPLKGCIITKLDEASRVGAALDTAIRYQLPIHFVSQGQKVPEHLQCLPADTLVDLAMNAQSAQQPLYAPTEADIAALMALSRDTSQDDAVRQEQVRRTQLLPTLLAAAGGDRLAASQDLVQEAVQTIDDVLILSNAYETWRRATSTMTDAAADLAAWRQRLTQSMRTELATGQDTCLAVHESVGVRDDAGSPARLSAVLCFTENTGWLGSVVQQWGGPQGWASSCGAASPIMPAAVASLALRLRAQQGGEGQEWPMAHVVEGGSLAVCRWLGETSTDWLVQVPGAFRLPLEDGATTAGALSRTLSFAPWPTSTARLATHRLGGRELVPWWACQPVELVPRGQSSLALQFVALRWLDGRTGAVVRQDFGLACAGAVAGAPAGWLLRRQQARAAQRSLAAAWQWAGRQAAWEHAPAWQALAAAQLGLAARQLADDSAAQTVQALGAALMGVDNLSEGQLLPALLKLYALKSMMG